MRWAIIMKEKNRKWALSPLSEAVIALQVDTSFLIYAFEL